jgi:glycine/D-amino acid oxidase-like deaminating enzyme/nitrite reductase/ring-hydroxylating ferredoxin subunit
MEPQATTAVPTTSGTGSLWLGEDGAGPPLVGPVRDLTVDVAVIGGGITGVTTALLLAREGASVALIEAARIGAGVTGCTTAKVSALQGTVYSTIRGRHGSEAAAAYAAANLAGVERIAALAAQQQIDCDLHRRAAYTYAADEAQLPAVEREADAAQAAGLAAVLTGEIDLPYTIAGAVRVDEQLEIHPVRYVRGLARGLADAGAVVCEGTRALSVDPGSPGVVKTTRGDVRAERVVVCSHYPFLDRGLYFARLQAARSYCIAARLRTAPPRGMSISAGTPTRSVRGYGQTLIVGGEGHATGASSAVPERYKRLEEFARAHWEVLEITHRWSAQDPVPHDHLPLVGPYTPFSSRLFVASGFMKWGLSGGTMAAMLLADLLAGRENPWAAHFNPHRVSLRAASELAQLNARTGIEFVADRLRPPGASSPDDVPRGEARVVRQGIGRIGVYRDEDGALHGVSLRCTHLGCLLRFNAAERSWDCPCHGSRFDADGAVLEGPATCPLERRSIG